MRTVTDLKILHSADYEIQHIEYTLSKIEWYRENGYTVDIPYGLTSNSNVAEITSLVMREYEENEYVNHTDMICEMWRDFFTMYELLIEATALNLVSPYTVILTKYGTGGSFDPKNNKIVLNIKGRTAQSIFGTLLHEITHISIHQYIVKYEISHWYKERLVDLIGLEYFPTVRHPQNIKIDVTTVDKAFSKHFPNIENVARAISGHLVMSRTK